MCPTQNIPIRNKNKKLYLFIKTIAVYCQNYPKRINMLCGQN